jgi:hypothetical protein
LSRTSRRFWRRASANAAEAALRLAMRGLERARDPGGAGAADPSAGPDVVAAPAVVVGGGAVTCDAVGAAGGPGVGAGSSAGCSPGVAVAMPVAGGEAALGWTESVGGGVDGMVAGWKRGGGGFTFSS